ncbi:MAG: hypothetical protein RL177_831 [Bacteroidota bacterium]
MNRLGFIVSLMLVSACSATTEDDRRVMAEVGDDVLTYSQVRDAIPYAIWQSDSLNATNEYIKQWTLTRLLASEAERLGLHELDEVAERIRTHRDDVLIETLRDRALNSLTDEIHVSESEIEAYFEENKPQFVLSERHVRIRHISTVSLDLAVAAKAELSRGGDWAQIVERYASDKAMALASPETLLPMSALATDAPWLQASMASLSPNTISSIREDEGRFHFVQLLETYPPGSVPDISWVKDRILEWLTIEKRRIALLSFEQQLLLQAQADGIVRNPTSP